MLGGTSKQTSPVKRKLTVKEKYIITAFVVVITAECTLRLKAPKKRVLRKRVNTLPKYNYPKLEVTE